MSTRALLNDFHQFAMDQLERTEIEPSIDELYEMWRNSQAPAEELQKSVDGVKRALGDMAAGDTGVSAHEHVEELRTAHNLVVLE